MLYDLTTLTCAPLTEGGTAAAACDWIAQGPGRLLGAWRTEIGALFQVKLLRGFDTAEALEEERRRALMSPAPFGISDPAIRLDMERYARFPFLSDVEPATFGSFYEFRTYYLKPGGLAPTLNSWRDAITPAVDYTRHLVVNMYALDGPPRITHIWGFFSLEERAALRARHYADGLWPPKGAPQQIANATSTICVPEPCSPLR
jgi:NIPSNAP